MNARIIKKSAVRWTTILCSSLCALSVLTSCSTDGANQHTPAASEYVKPAWMAEQRLVQEEALADARACLSGKGLTPSFDPPTVFGVETSPADTEEEIKLQSAALEECGRLLDDADDPMSPHEEYVRMLDVHYCIQAQGYPVGELQSEDVWTERFIAQDLEHLYQPYVYLDGLTEQGKLELSKDQLEKLQTSCLPTVGAGYLVYWS